MAQNQQTPPTSNDVAGSALFKKFLQTAEGYIRQPTRLKKLLAEAMLDNAVLKELAGKKW